MTTDPPASLAGGYSPIPVSISSARRIANTLLPNEPPKMGENVSMDDVDSRVSNLLLFAGALATTLNLANSIRTRGPLRATAFFALATGTAAFGEILITGPFGLLRHRTKPRLKGAPISILLLWYNVICGSLSATDRTLARLPLTEDQRREALPLCTAMVATNLDLIMDPFGLDAGLWEWKVDGTYAREVVGNNGHRGVPTLNYWGWLVVVMGVVLGYGRLFSEEKPGGRLPVLLLLPSYLASAAWAIRARKPRYLLYSAPFALVMLLALKKDR